MILKGKISSVKDQYTYEVDVPALSSYSVNGITTVSAKSCSPLESNLLLKEGDVVYVGFENYDVDKPIIIGVLPNNETKTKIPLNLNSATVGVKAKLPFDTSIGKVKPKELSCLSGLTNNALSEFGIIDNVVSGYKDAIDAHMNTRDMQQKSVDEQKKENASALEQLEIIYKKLGNEDGSEEDTIYEKLAKCEKDLDDVETAIGNIPKGETLVSIIDKLTQELNELGKFFYTNDVIFSGKLTSDTFNGVIDATKEVSNQDILSAASKMGINEDMCKMIGGSTFGEGYIHDLYLCYAWACAIINYGLTTVSSLMSNYFGHWGSWYSESAVKGKWDAMGNDTEGYEVQIRKAVYLAITNTDKSITGCNGVDGANNVLYESKYYDDAFVASTGQKGHAIRVYYDPSKV